MMKRRQFLALAGAGLGGGLLGSAGTAWAQLPPLRVGVLSFGTVEWELAAIRALGLDEAAGLRIDPLKLASNDAARIAFLGDAVDSIVSDLLWAARMRGEGRDIVFLPFSASEGAVMRAPGSTIATVADLAGKRIGVAGGALDKSWILLQAYARHQAGIDLAKVAEPVFGAPPLLSMKLEQGELDAALLYWNFCARLEAKGFKRLIGADEVARSFGVEGPISFIGYVFKRGDEQHDKRIAAFAAASRQAKQALASQEAIWAQLRPLMQADDEATYNVLRRTFLAGIPNRAIADERADAAKLYAKLAELGGEKLVGKTATLPEGLYWAGH
ncbi:ABC transporter substrate-binding protein [Labrys neptuniae]|uniref:ABC transporter substrate-binding protein n=1 Tax=Labrys TaxID=204476 RepID=UPI00288EDB31|nr:ABC transporter substrate-binding protein [Labrys neptuniae]MDT3380226.1 ABC transporter substrate-binding protein [Labrys neptuniae]